MKSTNGGADQGSPPAELVDEFDRLRETFRGRLRSDQLRLTTLAASLARIEGDPVGVFSALQSVAHRIRGAAAIFQAADLSNSAYALEQAATNACGTKADHTDGAVWSTLEGLVEQLAAECGGDPARPRRRKPPRHLGPVADTSEFGPGKLGARQAKHR